MNVLIRMYRNVLFPVFYINGIYFSISIIPHFSSWTGSLTCKTTVPATLFILQLRFFGFAEHYCPAFSKHWHYSIAFSYRPMNSFRDYLSEQSISKRQKTNTCWYTANQQKWDMPVLDPRPYISVGEVWKEKKNIMLVGNTQTSFFLYCTAVPGSRQLFCENAQCLVTLHNSA